MFDLKKKSAKIVTKTGGMVTLIVFLAACSHEQIRQNEPVEPISTESASIRETPEPLVPPPPAASPIERKALKGAHRLHRQHRVMVAKHHGRRTHHAALLQASHRLNTSKTKTQAAIGEVAIQQPPQPPAPPAPVLTIVDPPMDTQEHTSWLFWLSGALLLTVGAVALRIRRARSTQALVYNS
jgi:hypothetical protein